MSAECSPLADVNRMVVRTPHVRAFLEAHLIMGKADKGFFQAGAEQDQEWER